MATSVVVLRDLWRAALREELPEGWFYLPESSKPDLTTPVLLITDTDDLEHDERGIPRAASDRGFPEKGLDTPTLVSIAQQSRIPCYAGPTISRTSSGRCRPSRTDGSATRTAKNEPVNYEDIITG
ncbi:MAG TPA: hypothetical protein VF432_28525 [Thermoanaerobaculia bacterium]